jgi:ABC-type multidrug transport system permease subunit
VPWKHPGKDRKSAAWDGEFDGDTQYIYITIYYKMLYLIYIYIFIIIIILLLLLLCILYIYTYKKTHLKGLASFCLATAGASVSWFAP